MKTSYSTKEASEITGASRQIIRTYTSTYAQHFSTEGAPAQAGQPRSFTRDDLRLIRFIYVMTKERGQSHNQVQERIAAGELATFDWDPPDEAVEGEQSTALVSVAQLQAARLLLEDAQRREQEAKERAEAQIREQREQAMAREQELSERLERTRQELGEALGELKAIKSQRRKPPAWWVKIFGGGE